MFEKEAKERAIKLEERQTLGVYDNDEDLARDIAWNEGNVAGYEEGFKDGAEYGYNKAFVEADKNLKAIVTDFNKAKEIVKKFLEFVNNEVEFDSEHPQEHTDLWNELCEKAEQFISEVEK